MKKLLTILLVIALAVSPALMGCGNRVPPAVDIGDEDDFDADQQYTISFFGWGSAEEQANYNALLAEFKTVYPNITVVYNAVDASIYNTQLKNRANNLPDVFFMPDTEFYSWAHSGLLLNIDSAISAEEKATVWDSAINHYYYNRNTGMMGASDGAGLFGLPKDLGPFTLAYNIDLVEQFASEAISAGRITREKVDAALDATNPMRWSAFEEFLTALDHNKSDNVFGITHYELDAAVYSNNANYFNEDATEQSIDTPEFAAAVQFAADLYVEHRVMPSPDQQDQNGFQRFSMGEALFSFMGPWDQTGFWNLDFDFDIIPVPHGPGRDGAYATADDGISTAWVGSMAYSLSARTQNAWAAIRLARFLSMDETAQRKFYSLGQQIPNIVDMATDEFVNDTLGLLEGKGPANRQVFVEIAGGRDHSNAKIDGKPRATYFTYTSDWMVNMQDGLVGVWSGSQSASAFLGSYSSTFQQLLTEMQYDKG